MNLGYNNVCSYLTILYSYLNQYVNCCKNIIVEITKGDKPNSDNYEMWNMESNLSWKSKRLLKLFGVYDTS